MKQRPEGGRHMYLPHLRKHGLGMPAWRSLAGIVPVGNGSLAWRPAAPACRC